MCQASLPETARDFKIINIGDVHDLYPSPAPELGPGPIAGVHGLG